MPISGRLTAIQLFLPMRTSPIHLVTGVATSRLTVERPPERVLQSRWVPLQSRLVRVKLPLDMTPPPISLPTCLHLPPDILQVTWVCRIGLLLVTPPEETAISGALSLMSTFLAIPLWKDIMLVIAVMVIDLLFRVVSIRLSAPTIRRKGVGLTMSIPILVVLVPVPGRTTLLSRVLVVLPRLLVVLRPRLLSYLFLRERLGFLVLRPRFLVVRLRLLRARAMASPP